MAVPVTNQAMKLCPLTAKKAVANERFVLGQASAFAALLVLVATTVLATNPVSAQEGSRLELMSLSGDGVGAHAELRGAFEVPTYRSRTSADGRIVTVDVEGVALSDEGLNVSGQTFLVDHVTTSETSVGVRLVFHLRSAATATVTARPNVVNIAITPVATEPASTGPGSTDPGSRLSEADAGRGNQLRSVHVERRDGRDRVVLELSSVPDFHLTSGHAATTALEIRGATMGADVPRVLTPTGTNVVSAVRVRADGDRLVVEVDRRSDVAGTTIREGNRIVWLFAAPGLRPGGASHTLGQGRGEAHAPTAAAFLTDVPLQVAASRGSRAYHGRRIDLDFNAADIHNILRLLAEVGGVNIVTSDDVSGSVTIRMRNVPWDQALEVVLQAKGLGMVRRGNLIRVAPLTTLEKERDAAIARQKQEVDLAILETRLIPVSYATAEDLSTRVRELLTTRGTVSFDERTNTLIVRDVAQNLDDAEEFVRTLDTQTPQVLVEARIVEATSQYVRDVGIQWGGDVSMSSLTGNPTGLVFPYNVGVAGGATDGNAPTQGLSPFQSTVPNPNFAVNLPAAVGTGSGGALGLNLGSIGGTVNLAVRLSAAEASGSIRIVSSPRILTLDNHEASISQGTMIPYSQISAQGVQTAFQEAKLALKVRPHVTADGAVSLHVDVTRDEPDFTRTGTRGEPTILKRGATTDLLIQDGHTAVIGGIYTRTTGRNVDQVPIFGDIPILGVLFQHRRVRDDRAELLIFLTPRIVNRAEALRR